jgi:hypothetical protein
MLAKAEGRITTTLSPHFMNLLPLVLIAFLFVLVISILFGLRKFHSSGARLLVGLMAVLFLLAVTSASVFGFMATYELHPEAARRPWQAGYGLLAGSALIAMVRTASGASKVKRL